MPRMSKKRRLELSFFLNDRNRVTYNELCRRCRHDCKQSFRAVVIECPKYFPSVPAGGIIQRTAKTIREPETAKSLEERKGALLYIVWRPCIVRPAEPPSDR